MKYSQTTLALLFCLGAAACAKPAAAPGGARLSEVETVWAFDALAQEVSSHEKIAVEVGEPKVGMSLPREHFFATKSDALRPESTWVLARVAALIAKSEAPRILVRATLEDESALDTPFANRESLASSRAKKVALALSAAGVDQSRIVVAANTEAWEGDFDGPAELDPAAGRVDFVVLDANGAPLVHPPARDLY